MKTPIAISLLAALFLVLPATAADPAVKTTDKIVVEGSNVIELADGGKITIDKDGRTYHLEANGKRSRMKDGVVMVAKDGTKYLHKNDIMWKPITEKGTLAPNR